MLVSQVLSLCLRTKWVVVWDLSRASVQRSARHQMLCLVLRLIHWLAFCQHLCQADLPLVQTPDLRAELVGGWALVRGRVVASR